MNDGRKPVASNLAGLITLSVRINKWAQRLMYTLQTESHSPDNEKYIEMATKLQQAENNIEAVTRTIDKAIYSESSDTN